MAQPAARAATHSATPCITLDALPAALAPLPLDCVIDDTATLKLFSGIGCNTLGDCMHLPRAGLAQRGRQAFLAALDRALGHLPDPRPVFEPPPRFDCRIELPCEMVRHDALLFGCRRMLSSLAGTLAARQASVERFELIFEHDDLPPTTLTIHLGAATRDEARFALLVREHLSAQALPAPALAIRLLAAEWLHAPGTNHALFADLSDTKDERAVLIARLVARLGHDAVSQLQIQADHRPECSTRRVPPGTACDQPSLPRPRPLWLLDEPRCIGTAHRLTRISGPERIEAGWWDGFDVARDYYIARDEHGALLWVFQQLTPPHEWFVHGLFS